MASRTIRRADFDRLFRSASTAGDWELAKVYVLLFYGAFRISEVLQFSPAKISEAVGSGTLMAWIPKQNTTRDVILTDEARTLLGAILSRSATLYHFIKPVCADHLTAKVNKHIVSVLGEGYTSHGFRRGYVSDIIGNDPNDAKVKLAAALVGHRSTKTTAMYYEVTDEAKRQMLNSVRN